MQKWLIALIGLYFEPDRLCRGPLVSFLRRFLFNNDKIRAWAWPTFPSFINFDFQYCKEFRALVVGRKEPEHGAFSIVAFGGAGHAVTPAEH